MLVEMSSGTNWKAHTDLICSLLPFPLMGIFVYSVIFQYLVIFVLYPFSDDAMFFSFPENILLEVLV